MPQLSANCKQEAVPAEMSAAAIFNEIIESAWRTGEPGYIRIIKFFTHT